MINYAFIKNSEVFSIIVFDNPATELLEQFKIEHGADEIIPVTNIYVSPGDIYLNGKFSPKQPYPSWIFNEGLYLWNPPVAYPADDLVYTWNEETLSWVSVT